MIYCCRLRKELLLCAICNAGSYNCIKFNPHHSLNTVAPGWGKDGAQSLPATL